MTELLTQRLAEFSERTELAALPAEVVDEVKRIILDSVGCALAGASEPKGSIGAAIAETLGGSASAATIIGSERRSSLAGAAFANAESIMALDFDAILPPGHVVPFVLPPAFAVAEAGRSTGRDVLEAVA